MKKYFILMSFTVLVLAFAQQSRANSYVLNFAGETDTIDLTAGYVETVIPQTGPVKAVLPYLGTCKGHYIISPLSPLLLTINFLEGCAVSNFTIIGVINPLQLAVGHTLKVTVVSPMHYNSRELGYIMRVR